MPWDPELEIGRRTKMSALQPGTRTAFDEVAASVADLFGEEGRASGREAVPEDRTLRPIRTSPRSVVQPAGEEALTKPVFRLAMLGSWRLTANGVPLDLRSREQRVVALLALRPDSSRSELAATLWPDPTRRRAQGSLRAALFNLRREAPGLVAAGKLTVALAAGVVTDVGELIKYAERAPASGLDLGVEQIIDGLQAPELLPGWYEDWVDEERETQRELRLESLTTLAQMCLEEERPDVGQAAAAAALVIDPIHEPSCELLVKAHIASAEPIDAIREFERFRERMIAEVGLEPSERLYRLAHGTVDGRREQRPSTAQVRHLRPVAGRPVPERPVNRRQGV